MRKSGKPEMPSPNSNTPTKHATNRLTTASRVINAKATANSGGITDIQVNSIYGIVFFA
jgi:hypothetical protein